MPVLWQILNSLQAISRWFIWDNCDLW